jgi:beta-glucanase (GH16 family)
MDQVIEMTDQPRGRAAAFLRVGIPVLALAVLLGFAISRPGWRSAFSPGQFFSVGMTAIPVVAAPTQTSVQSISPTTTVAQSVPPSVPTYSYLPLIIASPEGTPQPIFADEFAGNQLDTNRWNTVYPWGGTHEDNAELECYTPDGVSVSGGFLHLRASKKTVQCYEYYSRTNKTYQYESGMLASFGKYAFQYGYVEMRARLPQGQGLWPAFWLLKEVQPAVVEWPPEIDVFEVLGLEPTKVYMTNWYGTERSPVSQQFSYVGPDTSSAFHTYGIDWQPGRITWYIDGVERAEVTEHVPATAMYLIVNLAVGGNWPGAPDSSTEFPAEVLVDYIRVYSQRP